MGTRMQSLLSLAFSAQCLACGMETASPHGLCGPCWRDAPFISGLCCDCCGLPLPGADAGGGVLCDACLVAPRPWRRGRAVFLYDGTARRLVLALKHGDRTDLVRALTGWMAMVVSPRPSSGTLLVPIPLFWRRRLSRRYNQAALLTRDLAGRIGGTYAPEALRRARRTLPQEGMTREERYANQRDAFLVPRTQAAAVAGRTVLLIDDVMTSGATLSAATEALHAAGAADVDVLVLARVARDR